ncbi:MAG: hypothetical protein ACK5S6_01530 [bacterium]
MTDIDKAARGIVTLVCAVLSLTAGSIADAWQAHLDALTAADMAAAEAAWERSGERQKAEALVIWEMAREGRCAPNVPQAAALPCPEPGAYWRPAVEAETIWTVGPAVRRTVRGGAR